MAVQYAEPLYHYEVNRGEKAPHAVDAQQLADLVAKGTITRDALVWSPGLVGWIPLKNCPCTVQGWRRFDCVVYCVCQVAALSRDVRHQQLRM